ncbi:hypothetical protein SAMN06264855_12116 [Halorubrum vacuolatum]|uniref:Uncharacterized protein n=1 Tax=Halorubrum vacuolatum TaxID=63740 RepID=A0A238XQU3_HALVU|nr:hypothetical protein SAMN06264855_12116 [Halorubrum vacuolatum]
MMTTVQVARDQNAVYINGHDSVWYGDCDATTSERRYPLRVLVTAKWAILTVVWGYDARHRRYQNVPTMHILYYRNVS